MTAFVRACFRARNQPCAVADRAEAGSRHVARVEPAHAWPLGCSAVGPPGWRKSGEEGRDSSRHQQSAVGLSSPPSRPQGGATAPLCMTVAGGGGGHGRGCKVSTRASSPRGAALKKTHASLVRTWAGCRCKRAAPRRSAVRQSLAAAPSSEVGVVSGSLRTGRAHHQLGALSPTDTGTPKWKPKPV